MDIAGKVFIVTGGASGLGEGTARMLLAQGGKVVIADLQADKGEALAQEFGTQAAFVRCDVSQEADGQAVVAKRACEPGPAFRPDQLRRHRAGRQDRGQGRRPRAGPVQQDHHRQSDRQLQYDSPRGRGHEQANEPEPTGERGVLISTASVAAYDGQIGQAAYSQHRRAAWLA